MGSMFCNVNKLAMPVVSHMCERYIHIRGEEAQRCKASICTW